MNTTGLKQQVRTGTSALAVLGASCSDLSRSPGPTPCSSAEEHPTSNRMAGGSNPPKGTGGKGHGKPLATCYQRVSQTLSLICREGSGNTLECSRVPRGIHMDSMRNTAPDPHEHNPNRTRTNANRTRTEAGEHMSQHHRGGKWTSADLKKWKPRLAATLPAPCVDCGRVVTADMSWQVGHIIPVNDPRSPGNVAWNLGPSHSNKSGPGGRSCNQSAGGRMGAAKTNGRIKDSRRLPKW